MIIRCEFKIRPESIKRIDAKLCSISKDEDVSSFHIERQRKMANKEEGVKRTEFLSTYAEIHAFVHGIYAGMTEWKGIDSATMQNHDVLKEPHYAKGGYIIGTLLRVAIIVILAKIIM